MRNRFHRLYLLPLSCLIGLSACHQSSIQRNYDKVNDECRTQAETQAASLGPARDDAARNAELVALFSDCMAKSGWAVATPKREKAPGGDGAHAPAPIPTQPPQPQPVPPVPTAAPVAPASDFTPLTEPLTPTTPAIASEQLPTVTSEPPPYSVYQPAYPPAPSGAPAPASTAPAQGLQRF